MLAWAGDVSTLAVGTAKGNLQLFMLRKRRRVPVVGKHTKRVLCGVWAGGGGGQCLAMGGADKTVRAERPRLLAEAAGRMQRDWATGLEPLQVGISAWANPSCFLLAPCCPPCR
jgi:hypothetical protein